jgi:peroxygenase
MMSTHQRQDSGYDENKAFNLHKERPSPCINELENPGVARFSEAADKYHPNGTPNHPKNRSVLQQHVDYFDRNHDGVVNMFDTFWGFWKLGFNTLFCIGAVFVIHASFSLATTRWPDPFLRIYVDNINNAKHGSDSGVYDTEGRFIPQKFEEIFAKWDKDHDDFMSLQDLWTMGQDLRVVNDFFGWLANKLEWFTLWLLTANRDGLVSREDIRSMYDGSLFTRMESLYSCKTK